MRDYLAEDGCPGALPETFSRRQWLQTAMTGFGMFALQGMLAEESRAGQRSLLKPHFKPKVKRVVFCYMDGGVSHVDSLTPNPN